MIVVSRSKFSHRIFFSDTRKVWDQTFFFETTYIDETYLTFERKIKQKGKNKEKKRKHTHEKSHGV